MPVLHDLYRDRKSKGIDELLSVSVDAKRKDYDSFIKKQSFPNPVLYDEKKTFNKWHVLALPKLLLIKDGRVVAQWSSVVERSAIADGLDKKQ